ncbi:MAG: hypothetical protein ACOC8F_00320 [Planctomycetota bacterium]
MLRPALTCCLVVALSLTALIAAEPDTSPPPAADRMVRRAVPEFTARGTLRDALQRVRRIVGVPVMVDWATLGRAGVRPEATVDLRLTDTTVGGVLDGILTDVEIAGSPLGWYADKQAVHVSTRVGLLDRIPVPPAATVAVRASEEARPAAEEPRGPAPARGTEFDVDAVPLGDVIALLRDMSDVNFHVNWKSLELIGVGKSTPVTLKARNISIARALDLVVDQVSEPGDKFSRVYWVIDEGIVRIATGRTLNNTPLRTRVYDVADLLMVIPDFEAPRMNLEREGEDDEDGDRGGGFGAIWDEEEGAAEGESLPEQRRRLRNALQDIVRDSIGRDMWIEGGGRGSVRLLRKQLVVSQTLLGFKLFDEAMRLR